ncbi:MAG: PLP-dependent aminotransferase family protein, partial [Gemmatimonadetes bacterium]|nr:PLP-dependent aminotransferase family protein [Gemmatimonadota bacterium]
GAGRAVPLEEIVLTSGSMQALQLITDAFASPGDTIVTESFSYGGSLSVFRSRQVRIVPAPLDEQGLVTDELDTVLKRLVDAGTPPKFIYTIPTHHNPTGSIMPLERRERLLELARKYDTVVVDDHCYGDIVFQSDPVPPNLYHLDEDERVVYVGSFSKILGPGVRQGYFMAPEALQQRIMANKMDGGTNALASMIVAEYFGEHLWDHIAEVNRVMKARKDAVVESLEAHFGALGEEVWWTDPPGGMFVWVRIPSATDTRKAHQLAASRGVYYTPGQGFSALGEDIPYLRIAYGFPTIEDIRDGIPILAECIREAQGKEMAA